MNASKYTENAPFHRRCLSFHSPLDSAFFRITPTQKNRNQKNSVKRADTQAPFTTVFYVKRGTAASTPEQIYGSWFYTKFKNTRAKFAHNVRQRGAPVFEGDTIFARWCSPQRRNPAPCHHAIFGATTQNFSGLEKTGFPFSPMPSLRVRRLIFADRVPRALRRFFLKSAVPAALSLWNIL